MLLNLHKTTATSWYMHWFLAVALGELFLHNMDTSTVDFPSFFLTLQRVATVSWKRHSRQVYCWATKRQTKSQTNLENTLLCTRKSEYPQKTCKLYTKRQLPDSNQDPFCCKVTTVMTHSVRQTLVKMNKERPPPFKVNNQVMT